jgi:hypothetical protein
LSVDLASNAAYVSYRPSSRIARQVKVVRGRTGRLGAVPFGLAFPSTPHVFAEFDAAGDIVGLHLDDISAETLSLADEFLGLLDLSLPTELARTMIAR